MLKFTVAVVVIVMGWVLGGASGSGCPRPALPTDVDLVTMVEASAYREVHLHGEYAIGYGNDVYKGEMLTHNITFSRAHDAEVRVSITGVNRIVKESRLMICEAETGARVSPADKSNGNAGEERMAYTTIKAGKKYKVMYHYQLSWDVEAKCPTVMLEMAVQPTSQITDMNRCKDGEMPEAPAINEIVPSKDNDYYYSFETKADSPYWVNAGSDDNQNSHALSVIKKIDVTIPHIPAHHQRWKFKMQIKANFLDAGDVMALLTVNRTANPSQDYCSRHEAHCIFGMRSVKNTYVLEGILSSGMDGEAGEYKLWIALRRGLQNEHHPCLPYSVTIRLFPLPEEESFMSCDVDPLPKTLMGPGMYDKDSGMLTYSQEVLVNLTERKMSATIRPTHRSLIRVFMSAHPTLDIDLYLSKLDEDDGTFKAVAESVSVFGPEGIFEELEKDAEYAITARVPFLVREFTGRDNDFQEFCDSFQLFVHVIPAKDAQTQTCTTVLPDVGDISSKYADKGEASFSFPSGSYYPFAYQLDKSKVVEQEEIKVIPIKVDRTTALAASIRFDSFGGRVHSILRSKKDHDRVLYSQVRTVGTFLHAVVQAGEYELVVLSPYTQRTTKTWNEMKSIPTCIRFSFELVLKTKDDCLVPVTLPLEFPAKENQHRHYMEEYRIPDNLLHRMAVAIGHASIIHLDVTYSDLPVNVMLMSGDDKIAESVDMYNKGTPTLFRGIAGGDYTLVFDFTNPNKLHLGCLSFEMQISVTSITEPEHSAESSKCDDEKLPSETLFDDMVLPFYHEAVYTYTPTKLAHKHLKFEIKEAANFRVDLDYDFGVQDMYLDVCKCSGGDCYNCGDVRGSQVYNGEGIATKYLKPGAYVLKIYEHDLVKNNGKYLDPCAKYRVRIAISPIVERKATSSMCPITMQYLPHSLNGVGFLWPKYHDYLHFFQEVLVSQKHLKDVTSVTIVADSILRIYGPRTKYAASIIVTGNDKRQAAAYGEKAIYMKLTPGEYQIAVDYWIPPGELAGNPCVTVPMEFSVMLASAVSKADISNDECSIKPFPTLPNHHGHTAMYRSPKTQFVEELMFTVGERGARFNLDIRYNFEVAGLNVQMLGKSLQDDGDKSQMYPMTYYNDRTYLDVMLNQGAYVIRVNDPVAPKFYEDAGTVSCSRYSVHMNLLNFGNYSQPTGSLAPGDTEQPPQPTEIRKHLDCPRVRYDDIPVDLVEKNPQADSWFNMHGDLFKIPFDDGVDTGKNFNGQKVFVVKALTAVTLYSQSYVRVWVRSRALVHTRVVLYKGNSSIPIAKAKEAGRNTVSLAFRPPIAFETKTTVRVSIEFYYTKAPEYETDYNTCDEKSVATSYEMFVSVFPYRRVQQLTTCPDDFDMDKAKRFPPTSVTADKALDQKYEGAFTETDATPDSAPQQTPRDHDTPRVHVIDPKHMKHNENSAFRMKLIVPKDAEGVAVAVSVKYNILVSNIRVTLEASNQTNALVIGDAAPLSVRDEKYNAGTYLHLANLDPNMDYWIRIGEANAERTLLKSHDRYCIPFLLHLRLAARKWPDGSKAGTRAPRNTPHVTRISPQSMDSLDVSRGFSISVYFSEDADPTLPDHSVLYLKNDKGDAIEPASHFFRSRRELSVLYLPYMLEYLDRYTVVLDVRGLKPASEENANKEFVVDDQTSLPVYKTASCSCDDGVCSTGSPCGCREEGHTSCSRCGDMDEMSYEEKHIGSESLGRTFRGICVRKTKSGSGSGHNSNNNNHHGSGGGDHHSGSGSGHEGNEVPGPDAPPPSSTKHGKAAFAGLRHFLAFGAMAVIVVYAAYGVYTMRRKAKEIANPFRRTTMIGEDGEEEEEEAAENQPIV